MGYDVKHDKKKHKKHDSKHDKCYKRYDDCDDDDDDYDDDECDKKKRKDHGWSPFSNCKHPLDSTIEQEADQEIKNVQTSYEEIVIRDSCDVDVTTTDTKIAASIQASLQAALVAVISISIGSSSRAEAIVQDLMQKINVTQSNRQRVYVQNSKGVVVSTTDSFISVNIQVLLQILLALVVQLDVL